VAAYATREDLEQVGASSDQLEGLLDEAILLALEAASRFVDTYIGKKVTVPLAAPTPPATYPADIVIAVAKIAAYELMRARGASPDAATDLRTGYDQVVAWLTFYASADGATPSSGTTVAEGPFVVTAEVVDGEPSYNTRRLRGW
jgi:phage gp36-like protein